MQRASQHYYNNLSLGLRPLSGEHVSWMGERWGFSLEIDVDGCGGCYGYVFGLNSMNGFGENGFVCRKVRTVMR